MAESPPAKKDLNASQTQGGGAESHKKSASKLETERESHSLFPAFQLRLLRGIVPTTFRARLTFIRIKILGEYRLQINIFPRTSGNAGKGTILSKIRFQNDEATLNMK